MSFDFSVGIAQRTPQVFITEKPTEKGELSPFSYLDIRFTVKPDAFLPELAPNALRVAHGFPTFSR